MILDETMPREDALAELRAVGARVSLWHPGPGGRATIYVNGQNREKLAEIWCSHSGLVSEDKVWQAIWRHVTS
jgi:hypothetical protein